MPASWIKLSLPLSYKKGEENRRELIILNIEQHAKQRESKTKMPVPEWGSSSFCILPFALIWHLTANCQLRIILLLHCQHCTRFLHTTTCSTSSCVPYATCMQGNKSKSKLMKRFKFNALRCTIIGNGCLVMGNYCWLRLTNSRVHRAFVPMPIVQRSFY